MNINFISNVVHGKDRQIEVYELKMKMKCGVECRVEERRFCRFLAPRVCIPLN